MAKGIELYRGDDELVISAWLYDDDTFVLEFDRPTNMMQTRRIPQRVLLDLQAAFAEPVTPNIPEAVDELHKAFEDLLRFVDLTSLHTTAFGQTRVKDDVLGHLVACRKHLGVE